MKAFLSLLMLVAVVQGNPTFGGYSNYQAPQATRAPVFTRQSPQAPRLTRVQPSYGQYSAPPPPPPLAPPSRPSYGQYAPPPPPPPPPTTTTTTTTPSPPARPTYGQFVPPPPARPSYGQYAPPPPPPPPPTTTTTTPPPPPPTYQQYTPPPSVPSAYGQQKSAFLESIRFSSPMPSSMSKQSELVNGCPVIQVQPLIQNNAVIETYCRCESGSYGRDCSENIPNPCTPIPESLDRRENEFDVYHAASPIFSADYFVQCAWGIPFLFKCQAPLVWDQENLTCNWIREPPTQAPGPVAYSPSYSPSSYSAY